MIQYIGQGLTRQSIFNYNSVDVLFASLNLKKKVFTGKGKEIFFWSRMQQNSRKQILQNICLW